MAHPAPVSRRETWVAPALACYGEALSARAAGFAH